MVLGVINLTKMVFKVYKVTINIIPNLQYDWNCFFKLKIKGHAILKQDREVSVVRRPISRNASLRLVHS